MKTGIVVEGGRMRGIYTVDVLDVLLKHGIKADGLVEASTGAIRGCSFVTGQAGCSIRYNLKYCRDSRYTSFRPLVMTGDLVGNRSCYHKLPERLDPLDNNASGAPPMEFHATYADVEADRPVHHRCGSPRGENVQWIRTSASVPLVSRIVEIDGQKLPDGGISDSIPVAALRKVSSKRSLVILTRPDDYREKLNQMLPAICRVYRRYPESIKAMGCRHPMYNQELEEVRRIESIGEISVMRPSRLIKVNRTENRPEKVQ